MTGDRVASTDFRSEMVASDEILKRVSDQYRRIRNTLRFVLGNLNDFSNKDSIEMKDQVELDKWIINATKNLEKNVIKDYDNYSYHTAVQKIHNFCVNELGGIYLDIKTELIKPLNEIFNKNYTYSVLSIVRDTIYQGVIATPPGNPIFLKLIKTFLSMF